MLTQFYRSGLLTLRRTSVLGGPAPLAWWLLLGVAGAHWVTLRNRRRVLLDAEGRVVRGLPREFEGVPVQQVSPLSREARAIAKKAARACSSSSRRPRTFATSDAAVRQLLEANPRLRQLLEDDCSHDCVRYRAWLNHGRRGPKPSAGPGDGRFDALNERLELKGRRRVGSWLEAVYVTAPPSRRWEDFGPRLEALEEAAGFRLNLPAGAEVLELDEAAAAACQDRADEQIGDLFARARGAAVDDEVPF